MPASYLPHGDAINGNIDEEAAGLGNIKSCLKSCFNNFAATSAGPPDST